MLQNPVFLQNDEGKLIHQCFRARNNQALFWVGAHKYFVQDQTKARKEILPQANIEGDKNAKYGLAIALLCESNDEGIQLLLPSLNQPYGNQLLQNYQQILQHTTFETNTFCIPKNQACKKNGVGHWDHECPYPYGNEELHVTCKGVQLLGKVQISQLSFVEIMFPKKSTIKFPHPIHNTNLYLHKNRSFFIIIIY